MDGYSHVVSTSKLKQLKERNIRSTNFNLLIYWKTEKILYILGLGIKVTHLETLIYLNSERRQSKKHYQDNKAKLRTNLYKNILIPMKFESINKDHGSIFLSDIFVSK